MEIIAIISIKKRNVGSESNINIEDKTMNKILATTKLTKSTKVMKIILTLLLLLTTSTLLLADDVIYDKPYGGKMVGKIDDNGFIYDKKEPQLIVTPIVNLNSNSNQNLDYTLF